MSIIAEGIRAEARSISTLEILGVAERELLTRQEGKVIALDEEATIPSMFRDVVKRYADRPAVYAGEIAYTFAELDRASNRVANALLKSGVQRGRLSCTSCSTMKSPSR